MGSVVCLTLHAGGSRGPREVWPTRETTQSQREQQQQRQTENEELYDGPTQGSESKRKTVFSRETGLLLARTYLPCVDHPRVRLNGFFLAFYLVLLATLVVASWWVRSAAFVTASVCLCVSTL